MDNLIKARMQRSSYEKVIWISIAHLYKKRKNYLMRVAQERNSLETKNVAMMKEPCDPDHSLVGSSAFNLEPVTFYFGRDYGISEFYAQVENEVTGYLVEEDIDDGLCRYVRGIADDQCIIRKYSRDDIYNISHPAEVIGLFLRDNLL